MASKLSLLHSASHSLNDDFHVLPEDERVDERLSVVSTQALRQLNIEEHELANVSLDALNTIISIESLCKHYLRWAAVDNFAEKILQGLVISRNDLYEHYRLDYSSQCMQCMRAVARYMPHSRSILLQTDGGIRKVDAVRGFTRTTRSVLSLSVNLFVSIALSYRLYQLHQTGSFDFSEIRGAFQSNSQRGMTSLIQLLAKIDRTWLQMILASPLIIGALKGLADAYKSRALTAQEIKEIESAVEVHTRPLKGYSYIWQDNIRQFIPIPSFSTVTDHIQTAERAIRWEGRVSDQRELLFTQVETLALQGRGMSRLNAMQSLAKIVHSLSMRDLVRMHVGEVHKDELLKILEIKARALHALRKIVARDPDSHGSKPSAITAFYASYLLWWLGICSYRQALLFSLFKAAGLTAQIAFLKEIYETILEAIRCPDKPGFRMFYGDYEVWANELTVDCFKEFVRQFRLISKNEKIQPFLDQLKNFHLEGVDTLDLSSKALTANETQAILQVLIPKMNLRHLYLKNNLIGLSATRIDFPPSLLSLDLSFNSIGDAAAGGLKFPKTLQSLDLGFNQIGDLGAAQLQSPLFLQSLGLSYNQIGPDGAAKLQIPPSLQSLNLFANQISDDGAAKLQIPSSLQELYLGSNQIGDDGAAKLQLPLALQSVDLGGNQIGPDGAAKLQLPPSLQSLDLGGNQIGSDGAAALQFPPILKKLSLDDNQIGPERVAELQLPPSLQSLDLGGNQIGDDGAGKLKLPPSLQALSLNENLIGPDGAAQLQLPSSLQSLELSDNQIGPDGAAQLQLPSSLQELNLAQNQIGPDGADRLHLPPFILSLNLAENQIGADGAAKLRLPVSLQGLELGQNQIGDEGAARLQLPSSLQQLTLDHNQIGSVGVASMLFPPSLQWLYLYSNQIGDEGAAKMRLPPFLKMLDISYNRIGPDGATIMQLPISLQLLYLESNQIGPDGAAKLQLPPSLQLLNLNRNQLGDNGAIRLQLPANLQALFLRSNQIGNTGVKVVLQKIPQTNLTFIDLLGNKYNASVLDERVALQRAALLRRCQDKLCHANTPLQENLLTYEPQTSSASRRATPFFTWLNRPLKVVANRVNECVTTIFHRVDAGFTSALNSIGSSLRSALSDSPAYFPNLDSSYFYDHVPLGAHHTLAMASPGVNAAVSPTFLAHHNMHYIRA